jgi:endonuclease/exonuclease/phosphatase family metal-dependent hydrolase
MGDDGAPQRLRVLFWNTFLLKVDLGEALPMPLPSRLGRLSVFSAPSVAPRMREVATLLRDSDYDVMALTEVFDESDRQVLAEAWAAADRPEVVAGPMVDDRSRRWAVGGKSSGLCTISHRRVVRSVTHRYRAAGSRVHDSDAFAAKGVLLVEVELPTPGINLEIYSTHLLFGGDLVPRRGAAKVAAPYDVRFAQVDELLAFVAEQHRPGNVAVVCGDFNIGASDRRLADDPERMGRRLAERLDGAGFDDVWALYGLGEAKTCDMRVPDREGARIDYFYLGRPGSMGTEGVATVRVVTMRQGEIPRAPDSPDFDKMPVLSDHAALELELEITLI